MLPLGILLSHEKEWNNAICNLEIIILSEVKSEKERQIPHDIIYMWNGKYEPIDEIKIDSQT